MQLYSMNGSYRLGDLVEGYDSLIWTERYRPFGEFELKTTEVEATMNQLNLGRMVALVDSEEIFITESHEIEEDEESESAVLTVRGRSFETFYENRITLHEETPIRSATDQTNATIVTQKISAYAAQDILFHAASSALDPNNELTWVTRNVDNANISEALEDRFILRGQAYDEYIKILEEEKMGVRNKRPTDVQGKIMTQTYAGLDRSGYLVFDVGAGHFTGKRKYFRSIQGYKTAAYVASKNYFIKVWRPGTIGFTGFDHRVVLKDFPDITQTGENVKSMLRTKAKTVLTEHDMVNIFEGTVSPDAPWKYKVDYDLGDKVLARGRYGISEVKTITEYTRVEDAGGERGWPTLG